MNKNRTGNERLADVLDAIGISMSEPTTHGANLIEAIYSYSVVSGDNDLKMAIETNYAENTKADETSVVVMDHE